MGFFLTSYLHRIMFCISVCVYQLVCLVYFFKNKNTNMPSKKVSDSGEPVREKERKSEIKKRELKTLKDTIFKWEKKTKRGLNSLHSYFLGTQSVLLFHPWGGEKVRSQAQRQHLDREFKNSKEKKKKKKKKNISWLCHKTQHLTINICRPQNLNPNYSSR